MQALLEFVYGRKEHSFVFYRGFERVEAPRDLLMSCAGTGYGLAQSLRHFELMPRSGIFRGLLSSTLPPDVAFMAVQEMMRPDSIFAPHVQLMRVTRTISASVVFMHTAADDDRTRVPAYLMASVAFSREEHDNEKLLAIISNSEVVGVIHYAPGDNAEGIINLYSIFVDSQCRRRGIGTAALQLFSQYAHIYYPQKTSIECLTASASPTAKRMFNRAGWVRTPFVGEMQSIPLPCFMLRPTVITDSSAALTVPPAVAAHM